MAAELPDAEPAVGAPASLPADPACAIPAQPPAEFATSGAELAGTDGAEGTVVAEPVGCVAEVGSPAFTQEAVIPKLTPVTIQILKPLGSKLSKTGETFPIRLVEPIMVDGLELVPAGAEGMGEVIHAKKSGGMGAAGELVVTARYLDVDGRQLPLRSMHWAQSGKSNVDTVNALNVASAASPIPIGLVGYFIGGGQVNVAEGSLAEAKTAADFSVLPVLPAAIEPRGEPPLPEVVEQIPEGDLATAAGVVPDASAEAGSAAADVQEKDGK